jgi:hypothetical protein
VAEIRDKTTQALSMQIFGFCLGQLADESLCDLVGVYLRLQASRARTCQYICDCVALSLAGMTVCHHLRELHLAAASHQSSCIPGISEALHLHLLRVEQHLSRLLTATLIMGGPVDVVLHAMAVVASSTSATPPSASAALWTRMGGEESRAVKRWSRALQTATANTALFERFRALQVGRVLEDVSTSSLASLFDSAKASFDCKPLDTPVIPWEVMASNITLEPGRTKIAFIQRRHELGEWEWPLLTPQQQEAKVLLQSIVGKPTS